ncbi:MAG: hypothetical protein ACRCZH_06600 [Cetobacterium sp.]
MEKIIIVVLAILNLVQAFFIIDSNKLYERMLKLIREQEEIIEVLQAWKSSKGE